MNHYSSHPTGNIAIDHWGDYQDQFLHIHNPHRPHLQLVFYYRFHIQTLLKIL